MAKPTGWTPGVRYAGYNGQVVVDDLAVTITREGFGRVASGGSATVRLDRDEVKVEHRPATRLRNGWVRITGPDSTQAPRFEYQDPNLVLYTWQHREAFGHMVELLGGRTSP